MVDEEAVERTHRWVSRCDRRRRPRAGLAASPTDAGSAPTVLVDVPRDAMICSEEAFAPVVNLFAGRLVRRPRWPRSTTAASASSAASSPASLDRRCSAHDELEVGGIIVNDVPTWRTDSMPYGGVKDSGLGREGLRWSIEDMTEPRLLAFARTPGRDRRDRNPLRARAARRRAARRRADPRRDRRHPGRPRAPPGEFFAVQNNCCHKDFPLSEAGFDPRDGVLVCAWHSGCFDVRTGEAVVPPATEPVETFPVRVIEGWVEIGLTGSLAPAGAQRAEHRGDLLRQLDLLGCPDRRQPAGRRRHRARRRHDPRLSAVHGLRCWSRSPRSACSATWHCRPRSPPRGPRTCGGR